MTFLLEDAGFVVNAVRIAREAGAIALKDFRDGGTTTAAVEFKDGGSPVTDADKRVDDFLRAQLSAAAPEAGWLSEETADSRERLTRELVFIVDPIDGTRAFMAGDPRWGVCIALVKGGKPVLGIVHMPALALTYAARIGNGATLNGKPIAVRPSAPPDGALVAGPPKLLRALSDGGLAFRAEPRIPSLAYRLVRVADGGLDAGIASTNACDWDIAAADIVLQEAGAQLLGLDRCPVIYNRTEIRHGALFAAAPWFHDSLANGLRDIGT